jgi:hypothetical protein
MKRCTIFTYESITQLSEYDNRTTKGVGKVAGSIITEIKTEFKDDLIDLGPNPLYIRITWAWWLYCGVAQFLGRTSMESVELHSLILRLRIRHIDIYMTKVITLVGGSAI